MLSPKPPVESTLTPVQVNWDTSVFNNEDWPTDDSQPLVLSTGDRYAQPPVINSVSDRRSLGFGQHADYVFGWQGTTLQDAMDGGCYLRNCSKLTSQSAATKNKCVVEPSVKEDLDACMVPSSCKSVCVVGVLTLSCRAQGASRWRRVVGGLEIGRASCRERVF